MPSEVKAISPLVDRLIRLLKESHCVVGEAASVGLALREALNNAVLHGNRLDPGKLVQVHCRCELGRGVSMVVKDQGSGFDPNTIPDPSAVGNLEAEHGRGIFLMRWLMDEVSFECGGTEVHMRKGPASRPKGWPRSNNESDRHRPAKTTGLRVSDFSKQLRSMRMRERETC
jgi:serine/threonine-protein kinase RsbW